MRFSRPNMPFFPNSEFIYNNCPPGEALHNRPSAPFLYEVASHVKKLLFQPLLLVIVAPVIMTFHAASSFATNRHIRLSLTCQFPTHQKKKTCLLCTVPKVQVSLALSADINREQLSRHSMQRVDIVAVTYVEVRQHRHAL